MVNGERTEEPSPPRVLNVGWSAVAEMLVQYHGIHEGWWEPMVSSSGTMPTVFSQANNVSWPGLGIAISLSLAEVPPGVPRGPNAVNAAVVNPKKTLIAVP